MSDECDPIIEADDGAEVLDALDIEQALPAGAEVSRSADGAITSIVTPEGDWRIHVDPASELGARVHRIADARDETPEECVRVAVREFIEEQQERTDG